jgi:hypothetical protein
MVIMSKSNKILKKNIVSKLSSIISEGTKSIYKKVIFENEVASSEIMSMLDSYIESAIWTAEEELDSDDDIDAYISDNSRIDAYKDVRDFVNAAGNLLDNIEPFQIGHDLWLTRNGHGTGFWDRDLGEVGEKLSQIASDMGEKNVFWDDEGKVSIE